MNKRSRKKYFKIKNNLNYSIERRKTNENNIFIHLKINTIDLHIFIQI